MDNLQGRVAVNRRKSLNITAEEITGQVNQAPVRLSGKVLGVGTPNLVVDVKANAKQLDLAHLRELFPALKKHGLAGKLDMDLECLHPLCGCKEKPAQRYAGSPKSQFSVGRYYRRKGRCRIEPNGQHRHH